MAQTRGVRGSNKGAARAMYKRVSSGSASTGNKSGARGSGSGAGGIITPADYAVKHGEGFGTTQTESLAEGLANIYGGQASVITDKETGATVVIDSERDEAVLIEPEGGLSEHDRKGIEKMLDARGDVPNLTGVVEGSDTPEEEGSAGGILGGFGDMIFAPTIVEEGSYEEGDQTSTGGGGGGVISKGMLLLVGIVLVAATMMYGGRK